MVEPRSMRQGSISNNNKSSNKSNSSYHDDEEAQIPKRKTKKPGSSKNKRCRPKEETTSQGEGKVKMRTAQEVINRILWDDSVPEDLFTVGYLDRFVGILERAVTAFNFADDLATLSHLELAIPTHRVQYIKYKNTIVWDKRDPSRKDHFFGSYPPMASNNSKALKIEEVMESDPPGNNSNSNAGKAPASTSVASQASTMFDNVLRPNFFVCVRVLSNTIKDKVTKLQLSDPDLYDGALSTCRLHFTLVTLRLRNELQVARAQQALASFHIDETVSADEPLQVRGLGAFRDRVLYAGLDERGSDVMTTLYERVRNHMIEHLGPRCWVGQSPTRPFVPHMTISKMTREMGRQGQTVREETWRHRRDVNLGNIKVHALHLCRMRAPLDPTAFYETFASVSNRGSLLAVPWVQQKLLGCSSSSSSQHGDNSSDGDDLNLAVSGEQESDLADGTDTDTGASAIASAGDEDDDDDGGAVTSAGVNTSAGDENDDSDDGSSDGDDWCTFGLALEERMVATQRALTQASKRAQASKCTWRQLIIVRVLPGLVEAGLRWATQQGQAHPNPCSRPRPVLHLTTDDTEAVSRALLSRDTLSLTVVGALPQRWQYANLHKLGLVLGYNVRFLEASGCGVHHGASGTPGDGGGGDGGGSSDTWSVFARMVPMDILHESCKAQQQWVEEAEAEHLPVQAFCDLVLLNQRGSSLLNCEIVKNNSNINDSPLFDDKINNMNKNNQAEPLYIFDFDGTLVHTPSVRQSSRTPPSVWASLPASLSPSLRHEIKSGPALDAFRQLDRQDCTVVVLTGRRASMAKHVLAILEEWEIHPDCVIMKDTGFDDLVSDFKADVITRLVATERFSHLHFFDDDTNALETVKWTLEDICLPGTFDIIDARTIKTASSLRANEKKEDMENQHTLVKHWLSCVLATTLQRLFAVTVPEDNIDDLCLAFGSVVLGRHTSDLDVCLLCPTTLGLGTREQQQLHSQVLEAVFREIQCRGPPPAPYQLDNMYLTKKALTPRIVIKLTNPKTLGLGSGPPEIHVAPAKNEVCSLEIDVVLGCVAVEKDMFAALLREREPLGSVGFVERCLDLCGSQDDLSRRVLAGPLFAQKAKQFVLAFGHGLTLEHHCDLLERVIGVFQSARLHGGHLDCIKTFQVVLLLQEYLKQIDTKDETISELSFSFESVCHFLGHELPLSSWTNILNGINKGGLPACNPYYLPGMRLALQHAADQCRDKLSPKQQVERSPLLCSFEDACFNQGLQILNIDIYTSRPWKTRLALNVTLPTLVRGLIEEGEGFEPDGNGPLALSDPESGCGCFEVRMGVGGRSVRDIESVVTLGLARLHLPTGSSMSVMLGDKQLVVKRW